MIPTGTYLPLLFELVPENVVRRDVTPGQLTRPMGASKLWHLKFICIVILGLLAYTA